MIRYVIELSILHSLFIMGYWIFLKREGQYGKLRAYLLGSTLLSIVVPLLRLPSIQSFFIRESDAEVFTFTLNPVSYISMNSGSNENSFPVYYWVYGLISIWFLYKIVSGIIYLVRLEHRSEILKIDDIWIRKVANLDGSFSFFSWIFVNKRIESDQEELMPILKHESAHVRLGHSYDLLFFQLFRMVFWWLPSAWYINNEIKKIHEYQADAYALKSYSFDQYSSILISSTLKSNGLSLASSFHDGLILKRLKAMKQNVSKIKGWKLGVLGILSALLVITFACSEEMDREIKQMGEASNAITFDQLPAAMQVDLVEIKDQLSFVKAVVNENEKISNIRELQELDPSLIHSINVDKENRSIYIAIKKDGANFNYVANQSRQEGDVFTLVEDQPTYAGGMDAFYKYIGDNMNYPAQARQLGIEGRVYVQFIVEKDGSLSNVETVKGIGGGCDNEAIRVIQSAPAFLPGKQRGKAVRVRMVLPVIFKLAGKNTDVSELTRDELEMEQLDEMIVVGYAETVNNKFSVNSAYDNGEWTGTVTSTDGEPLPGVNVVVAGTSAGTVSDLDGTFKIKAKEDNELVLSFVGYESVKLTSKK